MYKCSTNSDLFPAVEIHFNPLEFFMSSLSLEYETVIISLYGLSVRLIMIHLFDFLFVSYQPLDSLMSSQRHLGCIYLLNTCDNTRKHCNNTYEY